MFRGCICDVQAIFLNLTAFLMQIIYTLYWNPGNIHGFLFSQIHEIFIRNIILVIILVDIEVTVSAFCYRKCILLP
jgi:hypothetical protein